MRLIISILILVAASNVKAEFFDHHFAIVFIDADTEEKYGSVPLNRRLLASAIGRIADAGAKGIVLKFFLDQAKDNEGDRLLGDAFAQLPVILQARIDNSEQSPNLLPERFTLPVEAETSISGNSGWIPIPRFTTSAYDIGFVDYQGFPVSLLETYRGKTVKSLFLCSIELAIGKKAIIEPGRKTVIGSIVLKLDTLNQTSVSLESIHKINYIPFHDILEKDDWFTRVKNKVVILGYDGPKIPTIETKFGAFSAHRLYIKVLQELLRNGS